MIQRHRQAIASPATIARTLAVFATVSGSVPAVSAGSPSPVSFERVVIDARPPGNPWLKMAGDFNRDGHLDIAIGGQQGPLIWCVNPGWQRIEIAGSGWKTVAGAVGDVDGDGDADIVPGAQVWFENPLPKGDPTKDAWKRHRISDVGTHDVALADFDRDGRPDLVARDQSSFGHKTGNVIHLWRQEAPDQWQRHHIQCPHGEGLAVADLDRDGDADVIIGGRWFENDGRVTGVWKEHTFSTNWTWADTKVAVGDLNGDGRTDVVLAPAELKGQTYRLAWYAAPADPRQSNWMEHIVAAPVEAVMHGLAVADMNGDGHADIVSARMHQGAAPREVAVFLNADRGRAWTKVVVSERGSHDILVADFNGDHRPDILGANHGGNDQPVELWLNEGRTGATGESARGDPGGPRDPSSVDTVFPGNDWTEAAPESQGVDSVKLRAAVNLLEQTVGKDGARELVIIRHGRLIWKGPDIDKVHGVWSFTKSFTSTALGLLIDDGKCALDSRASEFVPELAKHYPEVTLRHFTTMTSGYRAQGDEPQGSYHHGPSKTPFLPNPEPLFTPPGSQYAYWDSAMNEFGLVLTRIAGEPLEQLFQRRIADLIGMNPARWHWGVLATNRGVAVNGGSGNSSKHIFISAREAARFGLLFLNQGRWNGRQLISAEWVKEATRVQVPASVPWAHPVSEIDGRGVYGFNWWCNGIKPDRQRKYPGAPPGTFWGSGHNNNKCFVLPEWNMVIVRLGLDGRAPDRVWNDFLTKVGEALTSRDYSLPR